MNIDPGRGVRPTPFGGDGGASLSATEQAFACIARLEQWTTVDTSPALPELRASLLAQLQSEQAAHAACGLVHQLAARALEVVDAAARRGEASSAARAELSRSCITERADLDAARAAVAHTATALVPERGAWIGTVSEGTTVRAAVLELHGRGRGVRALIGEGRPLLRGRALAAALSGAGVPTWLVVDAALPMLLSPAAALWLGAAAVTDRGAIVPVGGYAAALAAREHSVPVYVLALRRKFLPATTTALRIDEMPPAEVWDAPPAGVRPRNVHDELLPLELLRGVVVEDCVLGATEAAAVARDRALPEELAGPPRR
jgi:translation initiation factor 2B subunit (eIF-2B alpha/beta/delta family)